MGGATVTMTSGEALPDSVKAIIADYGYTSVWDQFAHQLKVIFKLPALPFMHAASLVSKLRLGYWLNEASSIKQVAQSTVPILFIDGSQDKFVPYTMAEPLYNSASCEKELLIIEGAGHAMSSTHNSKLYWSKVSSFLNQYIE